MKPATTKSRITWVLCGLALLSGGCRGTMWGRGLWSAPGTVAQAVQPQPALPPMPGPVLEPTTLAGPPAKSATEIGLELREEIAELEASQTELERTIAQQSSEIQRLESVLARAEETLGADREQLSAARVELDAWQLQLAGLYEDLRDREAERARELADLAELVAATVEQYGSRADGLGPTGSSSSTPRLPAAADREGASQP